MLERTVDAVGYDAVIQPMDDLVLDPYGSLDKITGTECIIKALIRRLSTPPDGYCRLVRSNGEYVEVDSNYKNPLYLYLSSPSSSFTNSDLLSLVQEAASFDNRIEVVGLDNVDVDHLGSKIKFELVYRIKDNDILRSQFILGV